MSTPPFRRRQVEPASIVAINRMLFQEWRLMEHDNETPWEWVEEATLAWARCYNTTNKEIWQKELSRYQEFARKLPYRLTEILFPMMGEI